MTLFLVVIAITYQRHVQNTDPESTLYNDMISSNEIHFRQTERRDET